MTRWKNRALWLGAGMAMTAAICTLWVLSRRAPPAPKKFPVASEWAALERCLAGDAGATNQSAEGRLRTRWQLADSASEWPRRCAPYAEALERSLGGVDAPLPRSVALLRAQLERGELYPGILDSAEMHTLFRAAAESIEGVPGDVRDVQLPPAPPLVGLVPIGENLVGPTIDTAADGAVTLLFARERRACRIAPEGGDLAVRCSLFPDALPRDEVWLVPGEGRDVLVRAALESSRRHAVYSLESGKLLAEAASDGSTHPFTAYHRGEEVKLVDFAVPLEERGEHAVGRERLWREERKGKMVLFARTAPDGPIVEIGPTSDGTLAFCVTPAAEFAWITPYWLRDGGPKPALAVHTAAGWRLHEAPAIEGRLGCRDDHAFLAAVATGEKTGVTLFTCGAAGCDTSGAILPFRAYTDARVAATPLGHRILVVRDDQGVRMRIGTMAELDKAPEQLLYGDHSRDGQTLHSLVALPAGDGAVVLLWLSEGVVAIGVRPDGTFYPVRVVDAA